MTEFEMIKARYVAANKGGWNIDEHLSLNDCAQQLVAEGWLIEISSRKYEIVPDVFVPTIGEPEIPFDSSDDDWGGMFVSPTNSEADGWGDRASSGIKMSKLLTLGEAAHKETVAEQAAAAAVIKTPLVMKGDIIRDGGSDRSEKHTVSAFDLARFQASRQIKVEGGPSGGYWIKVGTWWQVKREGKWVAFFKE